MGPRRETQHAAGITTAQCHMQVPKSRSSFENTIHRQITLEPQVSQPALYLALVSRINYGTSRFLAPPIYIAIFDRHSRESQRGPSFGADEQAIQQNTRFADLHSHTVSQSKTLPGPPRNRPPVPACTRPRVRPSRRPRVTRNRARKCFGQMAAWAIWASFRCMPTPAGKTSQSVFFS